MTPGQPEHASEDEDHEMTDYLETDDDYESVDSEDHPKYVDAGTQTHPEYDSDDNDTELNTLRSVQDCDDHAEEESEVEEDEDNEDDGELSLSGLTIDEHFCATNPNFNLDSEPEDVRVDRWNERLEKSVELMKRKADETPWELSVSQEAWVYRFFKRAIGKSTAKKMIEVFQEVIPESTKAILGCLTLTHEHIMALPTIDQSSSCPGVYLICFTKPNDQQLRVPSGLYVGSSIKSLSRRRREHSTEFKRISGKELDDNRCSPNGTRWMYVYYYAYKYGLVPSFRQIAILPEGLEGVGFAHADTRWLVRMLEHLMMLLLDTYAPSRSAEFRRYGYTDEMYLEALTECGVPRSIFHPLNHAMPLKQKCGWITGARVCQNCKNMRTGANGWYYDPAACELAVLYNCSACYWYRFRNNADRPPDLFVSRAPPTAGPCSNCQAVESSEWTWHPRDKDRIFCGSCRTHWGRYGVDRPPKREKFCADCGTTKTKGHWHRASGPNQKDQEYWCVTCAMRRQRIRDREARDNKLAGLICSTCGSSNPIAWKTYRTCMSCWQKSNAEKRFRKTRDRQNCWFCSQPFEKQSQSGTVWKNERQWHKDLKEWICRGCFNHSDKHGSFGVRIIDIEEYEIRCEDCHTLYSWRWTTLGKKSLDRTEDNNITWDHIICGNCYSKRNMSLARNKKSGTSANLVFEDKRDKPRSEKEITWQEYKGKKLQENGTYRETKLLVAYFLRVHEWDFGADQIIAEKMEKDKLELEEGLMDVD